MLSEATFDQLVELPGVGSTRAQQFLELREEAGGEVTGKWRAFKIIEGLRGKAMEYFDTLPVEVSKDGELLCKEMFSRFGENEWGLIVFKVQIISSGSKKGGIHGRICRTGKMYGGEGISFVGKSRGRIIFSRILSQGTWK